MKYIFQIIITLFLLQPCIAQDLFKKGTIVTWGNDTIHGAIRAPLKYNDLNRVEFKGKKEQLSYNVYSPLSLKSFNFEGGPYFASVRTQSLGNSTLRRRFAYVISHGEMDLYEVPKYKKGDPKTFYTSRDGRSVLLGALIEENGKVKVKEGSHINQLILQTNDCDHEIVISDDIGYNRKELSTLVEQFNKSAGYSDLTSKFKTSLPAIYTYSIHLGYPIIWGTDESIENKYAAEIGLRFDVFKPGIINALSFQTGIDYVINGKEKDGSSFIQNQLILPTVFQYYNKKKPVNPYFTLGPAVSYSFTTDNDYIDLIWMAEVGANVLEKVTLGFTFRSSTIDFSGANSISINLSYIFGRY